MAVSGETKQAGGLSEIEQLYKNRTRRAKELQSQGKKVVGYMCCFPPVEMFTALDLVPFRIMGDPNKPITVADSYLERIMCPFVRSCFDLAMKGEYDFLDGLVIPHSCDTVLRIYDIWNYFKPRPFSHYLNVPHMLDSASFEFFEDELKSMRQALGKFAGAELTDNRLREAISLHNEHRGLLRRLYELRKSDPPLISGTEIVKVVVASMTVPVREANDVLRQVIVEVSARRPDGPQKRPARILVYGTEMDDDSFVRVIEECGANVVMDDLCIGTKYFWDDVAEEGDPMHGLADRYLDKIRCARTYRQPPGDHASDMQTRFGYLKEFASKWGVNGVILCAMRFCDTVELDVPDVRDYLTGLGYPVLHLEHDYSSAAIGQLKTRIQAFLEMIG